MLMVKGTVLLSTLHYIGRGLSSGERESWLGRLSAEDREFLERPVLTNEWYPADRLSAVMESYARFKGGNPEAEYWAMGRASCEDSLSVEFRQSHSPASPDYIVRRAVHVWGGYYSQGTCEVKIEEPGTALFRVSDIEFPHPAWFLRIGGWMQRALELSGAADPKVTHASCAYGNRRFEEWKAVWKV